jgi:hypothetical protein
VPRYRVFGFSVDAERPIDLLEPVSGSSEPPDLRIRLGSGTPAPLPHVLETSIPAPDGNLSYRLGRTAGLWQLEIESILTLRYSAIDWKAIDLWPGPRADDGLLDTHLLASGLSLWLELTSRPVLHASAVELGGRAVLFLADRGTGKSTLAASFLADGHRMLSDDVVPVEIAANRSTARARPAFPRALLWPGSHRVISERYGDVNEFPLVHPSLTKRAVRIAPSDFVDEPRDIAAIFQLNRREATQPIHVTPLSSSESMLEMLRHSFAPLTAEAAGLSAARLAVFASVAETVPSFSLQIPDGLNRLADVRRIATDTVGRLSSAPTANS